jgi:hypothetical protein
MFILKGNLSFFNFLFAKNFKPELQIRYFYVVLYVYMYVCMYVYLYFYGFTYFA